MTYNICLRCLVFICRLSLLCPTVMGTSAILAPSECASNMKVPHAHEPCRGIRSAMLLLIALNPVLASFTSALSLVSAVINLSLRWERVGLMPSTRSALFFNMGSTKIGISSGSCCPSASSVTKISPCADLNPYDRDARTLYSLCFG